MSRDRATSNAKAVCALHAICRWAITGTPIQNRLTDLSSLVQFLQVYPFSDPKFFDAHISQPWRLHFDRKAILRLKTLVKFITLRRSKDRVDLPTRTDEIHYLDFNEA